MNLKTLLCTAVLGATVSAAGSVAAADQLYIPQTTYRTGPFAATGIRLANGFNDYLTMINARDGGVGGVPIVTDECETSYNAQKGVECYEATKGKGALVYNPYSTGITLQLIQKSPIDKIPVLTMGYGLSAAAVGTHFPWVFNYPTTYWGQASAILNYIASVEGGLDKLKGKKIGFLYLDVGYGREPLPFLSSMAKKFDFSLIRIPVGVKEMQNQSSHWLTVRKKKPDWMVMWGVGAMNSTAIKAAVKARFPMNRFIGNWWSSGDVDVESAGKSAKGYIGPTFTATGTDAPVMQDVIKHVIDKGKSQVKNKKEVGSVLYNRGIINAMLVVEAIRTAQEKTGKKVITGSDMRLGLENLNLDEARLKALGASGFTVPIKSTCSDHAGSHPLYFQQWDGSKWVRISDKPMPVMKEVVRPMLEAAADKYVKEQKGWKTQACK